MAISEESLGMFFAKYGPVGAVKIMWRESCFISSTDLAPNAVSNATARGDEEFIAGPNGTRRPKSGLTGFVAYMKRADAEVAVKELDGLEWGGCAIRVGWSKMIRIPARPLYGESLRGGTVGMSLMLGSVVLPATRDERDRSPKRRRSRSRTPPRRDHHTRSRHTSRSASSDSWSSSSRSRSPRRKKSRHDIVLDKMLRTMGRETEKFIAAVAEKVKSHGKEFEDVLREREGKNEKFAFLRNVDVGHASRHRTRASS
jgi:U2-associated protein SR140